MTYTVCDATLNLTQLQFTIVSILFESFFSMTLTYVLNIVILSQSQINNLNTGLKSFMFLYKMSRYENSVSNCCVSKPVVKMLYDMSVASCVDTSCIFANL